MLLHKKVVMLQLQLGFLFICFLGGPLLSWLSAIYIKTMDGRFQILLEMFSGPFHQPIE